MLPGNIIGGMVLLPYNDFISFFEVQTIDDDIIAFTGITGDTDLFAGCIQIASQPFNGNSYSNRARPGSVRF